MKKMLLVIICFIMFVPTTAHAISDEKIESPIGATSRLAFLYLDDFVIREDITDESIKSVEASINFLKSKLEFHYNLRLDSIATGLKSADKIQTERLNDYKGFCNMIFQEIQISFDNISENAKNKTPNKALEELNNLKWYYAMLVTHSNQTSYRDRLYRYLITRDESVLK